MPHVPNSPTIAAAHIGLALELSDEHAWALAQFLKRLYFSDFRTHAVNDHEAYAMRAACSQLQDALAQQGIAPR